MNPNYKLALAASLALALGGGLDASARALPNSTGLVATTVASVRQSHGSVPKPEHPCGYRVVVMGVPGTQYKIYSATNDREPSLLALGTVPMGGFFTVALAGVGCPRERPTQRAHISSVASAPIMVWAEYW